MLGRQPHTSHTDLDKVLGDNVALYHQEEPSPTGRTIPTHTIPFYIDDETPTEGDIEAALRKMTRNREGGHT